MTQRHRWPGWVYGSGSEPDARFSFANERTFLAWVRTALAFLAGGVALDAIDLPMSHHVQKALAVALVVLGLVSVAASWLRWASAERALRRGEPLPAPVVAAVLAVGVLVVAAIVLVATL